MNIQRTSEHRPMLWTFLLGLCVAATVWGEAASGTGVRMLAIDVTTGLLGCALLPALFRRPLPTALTLAVLAAVSPAATPLSTVGTLHVGRRESFRTAVGAAVAGAAAHILRGLWRPMEGLPFGWWVVLVIIAHAALVGWGAWAQAQQAVVTALEERAERAEAEQGRRVAEARAAERSRLAREMHDLLAHRLSLLATYAGALEYRPDAPPERLAQAAGVIRTTVHQALDELRDVITLLRDDAPDDGAERPMPALSDISDLFDECRAAGTPVDVHDTLADRSTLPGAAGRTVYRVLQEALTNARKHAPGRPVRIELDGKPGDRLMIHVSNPLIGAPAAVPAIPGTGTGLVGLTERVRLAGGQLDHRAGSGEFRVHAWLPWPA